MRITEVTDATEPEVLAAKLVTRCHKVAAAFNVPQRELGAAMLVEGVALLAAVDGGVAALMRVRKLVDAFERGLASPKATHLTLFEERPRLEAAGRRKG